MFVFQSVDVYFVAFDVFVVGFLEAQLLHVGLNAFALEVFRSVAVASLEFACGLLSLENGDGVATSFVAPLSTEHGAAEAIIVVEGCRAERVSRADPLRRRAGDNGVGSDRVLHFVATCAHAGLAALAK